jgi:hypothetical protein
MDDDLLRQKANLLRECIKKSQDFHRGTSAALVSVSGHMDAIDDAVLPVRVCMLSWSALLVAVD